MTEVTLSKEARRFLETGRSLREASKSIQRELRSLEDEVNKSLRKLGRL